MPIVVLQTLPEGATLDQVNQVSAELDLGIVPAEGLIAHAIYEDGGRLVSADIWESEEEFNAFVQDRLRPAIATVAARLGMDPSQMPPAPEPRIFLAHDVVKGA